jgi:ketosteroid isomerase-like protein
LKRIACFVLSLLLVIPLTVAQQSSNEDKVWSSEEAYWQYVKANDLESYRSLWREDFLGWPFSSPEPARKVQITKWITAHTDKGESLDSYHLERLPVQVSGDIATTTYRVQATWLGKGKTQTDSVRIIHTWHRESDGTWKIISGMSAPTDKQGH